MENQTNKNKGFSLIELLIAVALLSIVMIMVTQFMSTSSLALTKTKKNLNIQTEAMEVGDKMSDMLVQATYVHVQTLDGKMYELDTQLNGKKQKRIENYYGNLPGDLVVDDYPNYKNAADDKQKIILDMSATGNYTFVDTLNNSHGTNCSFRILTQNGTVSPRYVKPKYIYIQYRAKDDSGMEKDAFVIYNFVDNKIYMHKGAAVSGFDGFDQAKTDVDTKASGTSKEGLLTEHVKDYYFSADTEANTLYLDMIFEDKQYEGYTYNYVESILLRNTNVLTVEPQKLFKKK